ncbi:MAG: hypothetical protein B0D91_14680 [Oceanospirillales bacterium LUC14_002_19_P2]|nr:MAG: hypothetical protein B0D91_14680 [Oceanospirillales bacterium LUC14_002_19_P2]
MRQPVKAPKNNGKLVSILKPEELFNPCEPNVTGCIQWGEDPAEPEQFRKNNLRFLSGESLHRCWLNDHYRDAEVHKGAPQSIPDYR